MKNQTKALLLASKGKVSPKPVISFQFYLTPSLFFTGQKKKIKYSELIGEE